MSYKVLDCEIHPVGRTLLSWGQWRLGGGRCSKPLRAAGAAAGSSAACGWKKKEWLFPPNNHFLVPNFQAPFRCNTPVVSMSHKVSRDMAFLFSYVLTVPTVKPFLLHLLLPLQLQELHPRPQVLPWKASMGEPLCTPVRVFSQPKFLLYLPKAVLPSCPPGHSL